MPNILLAGTQLLAVDFLARCMRDMEPLAALTGGAGTGKTTALNTALARQESTGDRVIRVNNFVAGPLSLHRVLAASIGVADAGELSAEELEPVLRKALAGIGQAEPPILAVDDAQSLLPETLRYLCLLGNLREAGQPLFRILLVGRPGFTVRQPIPVHFTLEAMQPNAAREIVEHGLAAAGVMATADKVRDIVHGAQGNLRTLGSLLQAYIEEARRSGGGRRRVTAVPDAGLAATRRKPRPARQRSFGAWLVVPALLVVGAAGAAIVYHDGAGVRRDDTPVAAVPGPHAAPTAVAPSEPPAAPPAMTPSAAPVSPPAPIESLPPPAPLASGDAGGATVQAPTVPTSIQPPAPAPAAAGPAAAVVRPPSPASPPSPAQVAPEPPPPSQASVPPSIPVQQAAHFRVYNISSCHHGVCPRWSVTDLDQRSRFVAALDLSALHLDRDTTRRLREGVVDIIVDGSVTHAGPDGRTLVAETLQGIAPHHGLLRPSSSEPVDLAAPPQPQSPPPGFLALPAGSPSAAPLPLTPPR